MKYPIVLFLMITGSIMVMAGGEAKIVFKKTDYDLGTTRKRKAGSLPIHFYKCRGQALENRKDSNVMWVFVNIPFFWLC